MVTDSSACLPQELLDAHSILTVPLILQVGDRSFPDGSLPAAELFRMAEETGSPPRTASPSPADFLAAFRVATEAGASNILCLTLSAAYSGTYDSAIAAKELASGSLPGIDIEVVDTGGLAMTHGFAVLAAARALDVGATIGDAVTRSQKVAASARLAGLLGTTRYLAKGGRVPWIVHWATQILRIRPLLAFEDGRAHSIGRVRTEAKGLERLLEYSARYRNQGMRVAVAHTEAPAAADALAEMACHRLAPVEILRTDFTSVMAVHTGPGFVGLAFYSDAGD
ncbi:MAG TPA: DegV family protein [Dehalococcoidia bacterium]|nr:DegV family protein [Dehalococcoidia bacterium]